MYTCVLSPFSCVGLFATPQTVATSLLCPWDFPGKNTGVGCHGLLQGIFPTQGSNLCLMSPALQVDSSPFEPSGKLLTLIAAIVSHIYIMIYSLQNAFWFWTSQYLLEVSRSGVNIIILISSSSAGSSIPISQMNELRFREVKKDEK